MIGAVFSRHDRLLNALAALTASRHAAVGLAIVLFWVFVAAAAPLIAPYEPTEMHDARLAPPSLQHWLGTDHLARDVMSRLFWGTRTVVALAPVSVLLGMLMAAPLGLVSGYVGGRLDTLIMRGVDILMSFPTLLIYILIITSFGPSVAVVVISISLGSIPPITRIVRSLAMDVRTKDYVSAARLRASGAATSCCGRSCRTSAGRSSSMPPSASVTRSWPSAPWAFSVWAYRHRRRTGAE